MSFCKSFQTLLGHSDVGDRRHFSLPSPGGLCLIARTFHKPPYLLESSAVGKNSPDDTSSTSPAPAPAPDPDPEGFLTCTETLGSESSEERVVAEEEEKVVGGETAARWRRKYSRLRWRKTETAETKFPPPLPGLDQKGRPRSFLKAERKDGRFVLTEVQIERPEVFCAKREGGRLRLQRPFLPNLEFALRDHFVSRNSHRPPPAIPIRRRRPDGERQGQYRNSAINFPDERDGQKV
ncbi:hypothetical protein H6P81_001997 [Aristolochia fimbriata]|uniref:FAF domain-containing protein n=1 Tax=Aristolochia fimbriata TaxID=158543 RepID=A0AAV7FA33_ARIFI|nr:hypothetical protein H6P81_001997 [Aristolochia fimbriata]